MKLTKPDPGAWVFAVLASLTLGLAPFNPPHVLEKLQWLARGELSRPIDIFDLLMHGAPWMVLVSVIVRELVGRSRSQAPS